MEKNENYVEVITEDGTPIKVAKKKENRIVAAWNKLPKWAQVGVEIAGVGVGVIILDKGGQAILNLLKPAKEVVVTVAPEVMETAAESMETAMEVVEAAI